MSDQLPPYPAVPPQGPPPYASYPPPGKSRVGLIIGLVLGGLTLVIGLGVLLLVVLFRGSESSDELTGVVVEGDGYAYQVPGDWEEVTSEIGGEVGTLVDTVAALDGFEDGRANVITEVADAGGETDPEVFRDTWEANMTQASGAEVQDAAAIRIDDEDAIGAELGYTNPNGVEVEQLAYLVVHQGEVYSIFLSARQGDEEVQEQFELILDSWSWT